MKKTIAIVLILVLGLSAFGCKKSPSPQENPYTEYDLIANGVSDYTVVVPSDSVYNERLARDEIINFFYESTGVTLKTAEDTEVSYSDDARLILVGDTAFTQHSGIDTAALGAQYFTLRTVGTNVFICGGDDLGTLYGAYEFLHRAIGYEIYAPDEIAVDRNLRDRKLVNLDLTDGPDILWRTPNYGPLDNAVTANRFRLTRNIWMRQNGNFVHNTFSEYLPKATYEAAHDKWYSKDGTQLCYSARGDADELKAMQDAVVARMQALVTYFYDQGQYLESLSFTHEDNAGWCTCDTCTAEKNTYGTDAAVLIHFINPVAERMRVWMEETYPGHDLTIAIFAYVKTEEAPVRRVGNDYVPVDDTVYLHDNVALFYAPYYADYYYDFHHEKNATYMETLRKWSVISDTLYLWTYSTNFLDYLAWYDSFNSMQSIYRLAKEMNAQYIFDQGRYNTSALTGFDVLKMYLNSKLAWDVDADVTALTDAFFENYFKDAAAPMRKYFDNFRSWTEYLKNYTDISGRVNTYIYEAEHWPKQVLVGWLDCIDEAYAAIAPLERSDPQTYALLYDRILTESIAVRYHLIQFHGTTYDQTTLQEMRVAFKADADRLGFTLLSESGSLQTNVYSAWGIV